MLLKDKLAGRRLILASGSPRRRQILADAGLPFEVAESYTVDEVWPRGMPAGSVAEYLAEMKSDAYPFELGPGDILLTADTTVVLEGEVLGKPRDRRDAIGMLERLSGKEHKVITGVAIKSAMRRQVFSVESVVGFRELTGEEIEFYVDNFAPMDKAGGYGIQEWIGYVGVRRIEGSFYNVMGMPMQAIYVKLEEML